MDLFRFIFQYIKKYKFQYLAGILTLFAVDFSHTAIPRMTGTITDGLTDHSMNWSDIRLCLLNIFLLGAAIALGRFLWRYWLFGSARKIEREIRNDMFAHLETMDAEYYNHHKTGDLMTRFTSDLTATRMAIGPAVICLFDAVVLTILVVYRMINYVNLKLTLLALIPMFLICSGYFYYGRVLEDLYTERQNAISDMTDFVQESFSGVRVIKAFVRERHEFLAFAKANQLTRSRFMRIARIQSFIVPLLDVIIGFSNLATLLYGGYLTMIGEITLGRFVAFNQYINLLVWPMLACSEAAIMFYQGFASIRRIKEVMDAKPEVADLPDSKSIPLLTGEITFQHLTFSYQGQSRPTLKDINLHVPAGTTLAIVGRTGDGKTTLVNLLLHLYNTKPDMIYLDGHDICSIPLKSLRENIAYVPQDSFLFSDTLRENIAFGAEDPGMDKIIASTRAACIHDNITHFPDGYDTVVGERGVTLSGGQKQRSAIARALLKQSPILIMDDALSAVDTDTEKQILQNLAAWRKGKTTILIAHRISTIQHADIIMVLENGCAKEIGSHAALMKQQGIYRAMYDKQQLEAAYGERTNDTKGGTF